MVGSSTISGDRLLRHRNWLSYFWTRISIIRQTYSSSPYNHTHCPRPRVGSPSYSYTKDTRRKKTPSCLIILSTSDSHSNNVGFMYPIVARSGSSQWTNNALWSLLSGHWRSSPIEKCSRPSSRPLWWSCGKTIRADSNDDSWFKSERLII